MLVYIRTGNKRTRSRIKIWVGDLGDYHGCLRCPYNFRTCNMMCQKLEGIPELKEKIKEEFGIIIKPKLTPLFIERLRAKW
jgi:hypothetical protein